MCWLFVWKDGKQQLVQQIPSNISPDLMTYIAQNSGGNYGWSPTENMAFKMNNSSGIFNPFAKAHCVAAECSVVRVNPPLPTRDQMADGRWQMADGRFCGILFYASRSIWGCRCRRWCYTWAAYSSC